MAKRPAKPQEANWIAPIITVADVEASLQFYNQAFGFEKRFALPGPDGKIVHAEMVWNESSFMLGRECDQNPCKTPATSGVRPSVSIYVYCEDVDALHKRATAAGARSETPPTDMFWGDRMCTLHDKDGYVWMFATNVADFDPSKAC